MRAVPEFARLKRFGVAEQRNTAERVYTREDVGILLGFFFLFRTFSFFLLPSKKKEKVHCKTKKMNIKLTPQKKIQILIINIM